MNLAQLPVDAADAALAAFERDPVPVLSALDCLRVAVTLYDARERLIYLNQHFGYIFRGLPQAPTLIGRSYEELVRLELEAGEIAAHSLRGGEHAFIAARRAQLAKNDFAPRDLHLADGRIIEIKMRPTAQGGWIALWSDVTHARHDLGRLKTAIELSADAFAFWDREDRLVMWNPGFAMLHGCAPDADLTGISFSEMIADVAARGLVAFDGPAQAWMQKRIEAHHAEAGALTVTMASGKAYLVRDRMTRDGGRATIYTDVTDRQRTETAFAEQGKALHATRQALDVQANYLADLTRRLDTAEQGAANAKTTFLRTMSHELKTPLNAIIGFSDLLKSAPAMFSNDQVAEYAGLIHRAGNNLLTMLNQILDLTKIAAGRYPIRHGPVGVRALLDGAADMIGENAEDKAIAVSVGDCPAELAVDGDENALTAMVNELARNAVVFTHNGGALALRAERRGARVVIDVVDNGPGVANEDLPRLIEPFEQVGRDTASHSAGAGLGLPLVKALAELQGGTLHLVSTLGDGFTASLDLPAA